MADPVSPTLAVDAVSVRFDEHLALDSVALEVGDGEVVALLGPSGCGKTTLLRVVAGLQAPTTGRVLVDGADVSAVPPHRRGIGLMFQAYALFPHRDVAANVGFGLEVRGEAKAAVRARVDEVLALVGLTGYEHRSVGQLSGGEQQRVALARALAPAPRVLMLDEPLGALDRTLRDRLVGDLQRIFAELAVTVVYVTHDQSEALALADRVVVMDHGTIVQIGTPLAVWSHPADASVARLLGLANIVDVDVRDGVVRAPWGAIDLGGGLGDGPRRVVVRPDAIALGPAAPAHPGAAGAADPALRSGPTGRIVTRTFRGDRIVVGVAIAGTDLVLDATIAPGEALPEGTDVHVTIDPRGVSLLG